MREEYFKSDDLQDDLKGRAVRGAGATIFAEFFNYSIQMLATIILARVLVPEDFGLVTMITAFSLLLFNFGVNGFTEAIIQKPEINHNMISVAFWLNLCINSTFTIVFICLAPVFAFFYQEPRLKGITIVVAFSFIFSALSTQHLALLMRRLQFYRVNLNEMMGLFLANVAAVLAALSGWGYWAIVVRRVIGKIPERGAS
jgi:PST family polysaccharide transporter